MNLIFFFLSVNAGYVSHPRPGCCSAYLYMMRSCILGYLIDRYFLSIVITLIIGVFTSGSAPFTGVRLDLRLTTAVPV